jgi:hypothetical protein
MRSAWKRCAVLLGLACSGGADAQRLEPVTADVLLLRGVFSEGDQPDGNSVMLAGRQAGSWSTPAAMPATRRR